MPGESQGQKGLVGYSLLLLLLSCFSRVQLFAILLTVAHQAPLSMGFSRQEYRSGLPSPSLGDLPYPGTEPATLMSSVLAGRFFTTRRRRRKVAQSCPTLCDPMDRSPPGSSIHGIFQARVPQWGAIAFSRRSSVPSLSPGLPPCTQRLYHLSHQGSP